MKFMTTLLSLHYYHYIITTIMDKYFQLIITQMEKCSSLCNGMVQVRIVFRVDVQNSRC